MSEREKWMPSREDIATAIRGVEYDFPTDQGWIRKYDVAPVESLIGKTGLRAQIAMLEEIIQQPAYDRIAQKIHALRKELEG